MFCSKCGSSLSDGAQFCSKCGAGVDISVGSATPAKSKRKGVPALYVVALLVVLGGAFVYLRFEARHDAVQPRAIQPIQQPLPQLRQYKMTFGSGALAVAQRHRSYYKMEVPAYATKVRLQGHFAATGGLGNDIIVSVMTEDGFINEGNRHGHDALWDSDKVTVGDVGLDLPNGAGNYYLVFDNRFSFFSAKAVQQNIVLSYYSR